MKRFLRRLLACVILLWLGFLATGGFMLFQDLPLVWCCVMWALAVATLFVCVFRWDFVKTLLKQLGD